MKNKEFEKFLEEKYPNSISAFPREDFIKQLSEFLLKNKSELIKILEGEIK